MNECNKRGITLNQPKVNITVTVHIPSNKTAKYVLSTSFHSINTVPEFPNMLTQK